MLIRSLTMESIRHQFTVEEKAMMNLEINTRRTIPQYFQIQISDGQRKNNASL